MFFTLAYLLLYLYIYNLIKAKDGMGVTKITLTNMGEGVILQSGTIIANPLKDGDAKPRS